MRVDHDPLCKWNVMKDLETCLTCISITEARKDMLAKCIEVVENWPVSSWQQHTQPDGTKEPKSLLIDKSDVVNALRALQEKP